MAIRIQRAQGADDNKLDKILKQNSIYRRSFIELSSSRSVQKFNRRSRSGDHTGKQSIGCDTKSPTQNDQCEPGCVEIGWGCFFYIGNHSG